MAIISNTNFIDGQWQHDNVTLYKLREREKKLYTLLNMDDFPVPYKQQKIDHTVIDWLMMACYELHLKRETFQLAILYYFQFYTALEESHEYNHRAKAQLVGLACLWLAYKIEELQAVEKIDMDLLADLCNKAYSRADIRKAEKIVFAKIHPFLSAFTVYRWFLLLLMRLCSESTYDNHKISNDSISLYEVISRCMQGWDAVLLERARVCIQCYYPSHCALTMLTLITPSNHATILSLSSLLEYNPEEMKPMHDFMSVVFNTVVYETPKLAPLPPPSPSPPAAIPATMSSSPETRPLSPNTLAAQKEQEQDELYSIQFYSQLLPRQSPCTSICPSPLSSSSSSSSAIPATPTTLLLDTNDVIEE